MEPNEPAAFAQLKANFEGKEAIYIEKGAIRVRISNIRMSGRGAVVNADVEEIPTPGLGVGYFAIARKKEPGPRHWRIGAGPLTQFSEHSWCSGYGWIVHFHPELVRKITALAAELGDKMDPHERYKRILELIQKPYRPFDETWQPVFPERASRPSG